MISKTQQRFKSERHNVFTEEISKIPLSSNDDKRMQSFDSIETYSYGSNKRKHKITYSNWPQIPNHAYRKLIITAFGSGKTNSLFSLINEEPDIDKIYLYA